MILLKQFLPKMSRILKFRKKRLSKSGEGVVQLGGEKEKVEKSYSLLVTNVFSLPRKVLSNHFLKIEGWLKNTLSQTNQNPLKEINKRYIAFLGERAVSQSLALYPAYTLPVSQTQDLSEKKQEKRSLSFFLLKSLVDPLRSPSVSAHSAKHKATLTSQKRKNNQPPKEEKKDLVEKNSQTSLPQSKGNTKGKKTSDEKPTPKKRGKSKE